METPVKALMSGSPISIEADASALMALDLMVDHGIRHLPVVDAERRVVGVLSIDDLRAAFPSVVSLRRPPGVEERDELRDVTVAEVMTYAPETVQADTPLEHAAQLMSERRIGCLPVLDADGRLDGILSETDLLRALATVLWTDRVRRQRSSLDDELVAALRREREQLADRLAEYNRLERDLTAREREVPTDLPEHGSDATTARFTEHLADLAARRLRALEHALERAEAGRLRTCERCAAAIPEGRLRALPGTTLCIRCARSGAS